MTGFEGHGDFNGDPWERYIAHQAAKGRLWTRPIDKENDPHELTQADMQTERVEQGDDTDTQQGWSTRT